MARGAEPIGELVYDGIASGTSDNTQLSSVGILRTLTETNKQYLIVLKCTDQTTIPTVKARPLYYVFLYDGQLAAGTSVKGLKYSYMDTSGNYSLYENFENKMVDIAFLQAFVRLVFYCDPDTAQFHAGTSYTLQIYKL